MKVAEKLAKIKHIHRHVHRHIRKDLDRTKVFHYVIGVITVFLILSILWSRIDTQLPHFSLEVMNILSSVDMANAFREVTGSSSIVSLIQNFREVSFGVNNNLFLLFSSLIFANIGLNYELSILLNAFVWFFAELMIFFATRKFLETHKIEYAERIAFISIIIFNLIPGVFAAQRFFIATPFEVLVIATISFIALNSTKVKSLPTWLALGILMGTTIMQNVLLFLAGMVPLLYFLNKQSGLTQDKTEIGKRMTIFLCGILPFFPFAKFNFNFDLAASLNIYLSTVLWTFGFTTILSILGVITFLYRDSLKKIFKGGKLLFKTSATRKLLLQISKSPFFPLLVAPIPYLFVPLFSSVSSFYFIAVLPFWIVIIAYILNRSLLTSSRPRLLIFLFIIIFAYPYLQAFATILPSVNFLNAEKTSIEWSSGTEVKRKYFITANFLRKSKYAMDMRIATLVDQKVYDSCMMRYMMLINGFDVESIDRCTYLAEAYTESINTVICSAGSPCVADKANWEMIAEQSIENDGKLQIFVRR